MHFKLLTRCLFLFFLLTANCESSPGEPEDKKNVKPVLESIEATSKIKVPVYDKFDDLAPLLNKQNDTTYVINFWATWCKPCVNELPLFEKLTEENKGKAFKTILVSLDFPKQIESKLIPFIEKNKLKSAVVVLTDGKQQVWIDKVDKKWDGAIPVTLIYKNDERKFFYGEVHDYAELKDYVDKLL